MVRSRKPQPGPTTFGEQVEWIQKELGISWKTFAADVESTPETLRRWRAGDAPTSYTTKTVARVDQYAQERLPKAYPPAPHHLLLRGFLQLPVVPGPPRRFTPRRRPSSVQPTTVVEEVVTPVESDGPDRLDFYDKEPSDVDEVGTGRGGDAGHVKDTEVPQRRSWPSTASPVVKVGACIVVGGVLAVGIVAAVTTSTRSDETSPAPAPAAGPTTSLAVPGPPPSGTFPEIAGVRTGVSVFSTTGGARPSPDVPEKIPFGTVVDVRCYSNGPGGIASTNGFYLIADGPWSNQFAPADTFTNGDMLGDTNAQTPFDPAVPAC